METEVVIRDREDRSGVVLKLDVVLLISRAGDSSRSIVADGDLRSVELERAARANV